MSNTRWLRLWEVFHAAAELPPEARQSFVAGECAGDDEMAFEVLGLLAGIEDPEAAWTAGPRLEWEPADAGASDFDESLAGTRIGPYLIVRLIGEGGMGSVYEAEQEAPVRRRVAVKVIKRGMDTREVVRRFENERQALALMNHSGIARVFDAGSTPDGRPYFVMELVEGQSLTDLCDSGRLGLRDRLTLFATMCDAIQHAHQKGVIHRDLKPSNVLVTREGESLVPKVIDFGIAKAIGAGLDAGTMHTSVGTVMGTLAYMSPEQATIGAVDVDTRADIYALCAILYEMLCGVPPLPAGLDLLNALRQIREDDPLPPSSRLAALTEQERESFAARLLQSVSSLRLQLRELDWIVMKGLAKDRAQRYATPADLAADIRRFQGGLPVAARPPSRTYVLRKYLRRHRTAAATAAVFLLFVVGFAISMTIQSIRLERALGLAESQRARAEQVSRFLVEMLALPDPVVANGESLTVREVLDRAYAKLPSELSDQPDLRATMLETIGQVYRALGITDRASALLTEAVAMRRQPPGNAASLARALVLRGEVAHDDGDYPAAESDYREAIAVAGTSGPSAERINAMQNLSVLALDRGEATEGERLARDTLAIRAEFGGSRDDEYAANLLNIGRSLRQQGELEASAKFTEEGLVLLRQLHGNRHTLVATALGHHGAQLGALGRQQEALTDFQESLSIFRDVLGADHSYVAAMQTNLAGALFDLGRLQESVAAYRAARDHYARLVGGDNPQTGNAQFGLGRALLVLGRYDEAERELRGALAMDQQAYGEDNRNVAFDLTLIGNVLLERGEFDEAIALFERAQRIRLASGGPKLPDALLGLRVLGLAHARRGDSSQGIRMLREALDGEREVLGAAHVRTVATSVALGEALNRAGQAQEACAVLSSALDIAGKQLAEGHWQTAALKHELGLCERALGHPDKATRQLREALAMRRAVFPDGHKAIAATRAALEED
jgi:non-specific serine/threonine protein kinase/serine/threonine-protein kinase